MNETTMSRLLGAGVVLVIGVLLFNYFKSINKVDREQTSSATTEVSQSQVPTGDDLPGEYVVQKGDTLWSIAEKAYGSGYNWVDIVSANKETIIDANKIDTGMKITVPKAERRELAHKIRSGDTLSGVALSYCGDASLWNSIASANDIADAKLIQPGQVVKFTCLRD